MDRGGRTPLEVNSFYCDEDPPVSPPDSGKKRKLQYEHLGLPVSKHKFRDRCSSPAQGSPVSQTHLESDEKSEESTNLFRTNRKLDDGPEPSEVSSKDSNSSVAGDDSDGQAEMSPENLIFLQGPSPSSSSSRIDSSFRSRLYSLESRTVKNGDPRELTAALHGRYSDAEDEIQEEEPKCGAYEESIEECCPDAAIEELMLYSNDVAPHAFALPSGRWGFKQDAGLGARKPTIDQEFEQYFSMLML